MPCYQCGHCGKCDMYSRVLELKCAVCDSVVPPGVQNCPNCGADLAHNMKVGNFVKTTNKVESQEEPEKEA